MEIRGGFFRMSTSGHETLPFRHEVQRDDSILLLSLWDRPPSNSSYRGESACLTPKWLARMNHVPIL